MAGEPVHRIARRACLHSAGGKRAWALLRCSASSTAASHTVDSSGDGDGSGGGKSGGGAESGGGKSGNVEPDDQSDDESGDQEGDDVELDDMELGEAQLLPGNKLVACSPDQVVTQSTRFVVIELEWPSGGRIRYQRGSHSKLPAAEWLHVFGCTPDRDDLAAAAGDGNLAFAKWVFHVMHARSNNGYFALRTSRTRGLTAIEAAARGGHLDVVKWICGVEGSHAIRAQCIIDSDIMNYVAFSGNVELGEWLWETYGASIYMCDLYFRRRVASDLERNDGGKVLQAAATNGHVPFASWALAKGYRFGSNPQDVLNAALNKGHSAFVSWLTQVFCDMDIPLPAATAVHKQEPADAK